MTQLLKSVPEGEMHLVLELLVANIPRVRGEGWVSELGSIFFLEFQLEGLISKTLAFADLIRAVAAFYFFYFMFLANLGLNLGLIFFGFKFFGSYFFWF